MRRMLFEHECACELDLGLYDIVWKSQYMVHLCCFNCYFMLGFIGTMPRTKTTTPPSRFHIPTKRGRDGASSNWPPRQQLWDQSSFTSYENQEWYDLHDNKNFIIDKDVAKNVDAYL